MQVLISLQIAQCQAKFFNILKYFYSFIKFLLPLGGIHCKCTPVTFQGAQVIINLSNHRLYLFFFFACAFLMHAILVKIQDSWLLVNGCNSTGFFTISQHNSQAMNTLNYLWQPKTLPKLISTLNLKNGTCPFGKVSVCFLYTVPVLFFIHRIHHSP